MYILQALDIHKKFDSLKVLKGVSLQVEKGQVIAIIGPSGSGKSTFLRCLNHLETIDRGEIKIEGEFMARNGTDGLAIYSPEKEIDQIIYNDILKLTEDEQIIIQDTLVYSLDLFEKQAKSDAVKPILEIDHYTNRITKELNDWLDDVDLKVSATHYKIDRSCPLYMVKLSFGSEQKKTEISKEDIRKELKILDKKLWKEEAKNLYFRKKLNYFDGDDVYVIKPNQRRFWSQTTAMEDSKSLLVEILNMKK